MKKKTLKTKLVATRFLGKDLIQKRGEMISYTIVPQSEKGREESIISSLEEERKTAALGRDAMKCMLDEKESEIL